jgi:hypothetical protein
MAKERLHGGRRIVAALIIMFAGAIVASCGAPEYTYVKNSDEKTYLKVPNSWTKVDQQRLDDFYSPYQTGTFNNDRHLRRTWSVAYDASAYPTDLHLLRLDVPTDRPIMYLSIRKLFPEEKAAISLDGMRNIVFPVTEQARAAYAQRTLTSRLTDFELLFDRELTLPSGLHGIREAYNWRVPSDEYVGGVVNTFDLTVYLSPDSGTLYILFVRCDFDCYQQYYAEIDAVANSLTIRS